MKMTANQRYGATNADADNRLAPSATTSSRSTTSRTTLGLMLLLAVLCLIWFASLGTRSLITPDEGRYATIALEMARSGDWVTPRLNGLLYFEKPVLQYWVGGLAFLAFGVSDFTARLWPGAGRLPDGAGRRLHWRPPLGPRSRHPGARRSSHR